MCVSSLSLLWFTCHLTMAYLQTVRTSWGGHFNTRSAVRRDRHQSSNHTQSNEAITQSLQNGPFVQRLRLLRFLSARFFIRVAAHTMRYTYTIAYTVNILYTVLFVQHVA